MALTNILRRFNIGHGKRFPRTRIGMRFPKTRIGIRFPGAKDRHLIFGNTAAANAGDTFMTSIRDVAREAGVAISTVSKVLNHYPNVSADTKEKVESAVEKLHFVPNAAAAALSSKQAARIALVLDPSRNSSIGDEINMQYISGALNSAMELKLDAVTLFSAMTEERTPEEMTQYLQTQCVTGVIVFCMNRNMSTMRRIIDEQQFCCVAVDAPLVNRRTSCISVDNVKAQYDVAARMIRENNVKKVLYLRGSSDGYVAEDRLIGMQRLASEKSLSLVVANGEFSEKKARELTGDLAADRDAVVCASDMMAIGTMRRLTEMDIFKPVCGFDGISLMGYAGNRMYTVRQDFGRIAAESVREVYRLMNGAEGRKIIMPHEIVRMKYEDVIA
jgi:LacI family transcriptional regulator